MQSKEVRGFLFVMTMVLLLGAPGHVLAVDVVVNGSFETGDFTGWGTKDMAAPFFPLAVRGPGIDPGFGFFTSTPTSGAFAATHGFDGAGPDTIEIFQDVLIPAGFSGTLTFDWRGAWDMAIFGATAPRLFDLVIEPGGGGGPLSTTNILTAAPGTTVLDTGAISETFDLSAFAGLPIRVNFKSTIPENFTGPGHFQIDTVALDIQPLDDDGDGVLNDVDACPDTVIPESTVPAERLGVNRWALVDADGTFDTTAPYGGGVGPMKSFSIEDTSGCSCEQIIDILLLGGGHTKYGCSISAMEEFIISLGE